MNNKKITAKMISLMSKQSLKSSRMRNTFVMITIVLASALLTGILMFAAGRNQEAKNILSHSQQVAYYNLTGEQVETLKQDERISYQIQVKTGVLSEIDSFDVMPYYVSGLSDEIRVGELESGKLPESENEAAVQAALLKKMGVEPIVGSRITFPFYDGNTETFTVSGILKGGDTAKQFSVFFSESYAGNGSQLKDRTYEVFAKLHNATELSPEECKEEMYLIGSDAGIERKYVSPSKSFIDSLSIDTQSVMLCVLVGTVILLACVLVIYGVFYLSVIGRIHQFGQLRTVGMAKKQMKKLVVREGGALYLRSGPVGILIGIAAGYLIVPDGFHIGNTLLITALVFVVVYVITIISVQKPARLAAAVSPMEALRYVPQDGMKEAENKKMCRSLTPLGLGAMSFSKNKKKAVITMLSLAFGGILFMTAAAFMSSFNKESYARQGNFADAEFSISFSRSAIELNENGMSGMQAKAPLDEEVIRKISALDGVKKVKEMKSFGISYDYPKQDEYGINDVIYPMTENEIKQISKHLESGSADYDKLMSGDFVLVTMNELVKEINGWQFEAGDRITLHYYDGGKMAEKEVTILGFLSERYVKEHEEYEGAFLMPEQVILDWVSYESLNNHLLVSTQAEKEAEAGEKLAQMIAGKPEWDLYTLEEQRAFYAQTTSRLFTAISGLAVFIMMFSILSMMNTLITNIVTRKQELAMLESIGMCKGQRRKMLLGESLILVFAAVGVTMTIGTLCGYILIRIMYRMGAVFMVFRFPAAFVLVYTAVLVLVPFLITLVIMHGFSKEALVERLRGAEN